MSKDEILRIIEDAKTEILGKRNENAWQLLERLAIDIEKYGLRQW